MLCVVISYNLLAQGTGTVQVVNFPDPKHFQIQVPIDANSFACEVKYEEYYSEISYFNPELLRTLGEGMLHMTATYLSRDPRSYFSKCDLHTQILEDAAAHGNMVSVDVDVTWHEMRTIVRCEGGSWGGCTRPIFAWVPATEVVLTFQNGLQLTSRECGELMGCRD